MRRTWSLRLWGRGRREARSTPTAADRRRWQYRHLWLATALLGLALWAIIAVRPPAIPGLRLGYPSPVSIQAPRTSIFVSKIRTEQERTRAESDPNTIVYRPISSILSNQRAELSGLLQTISLIHDDHNLDRTSAIEKLISLPGSTLVISRTLAEQITNLDDGQWSNVRLQAQGLYDRALEKYNFDLDDQAVTELRERSLPYWSSQNSQGVEADLILLFSSSFVKPNRVLDKDATRERKQEARDQVQPVMVQLLEGESIVRAGDVITPEVQEKLEAIGVAQNETDWMRMLGRGLLAGLVAAVFGLYLALAQPAIWDNDRPILVVDGLFALTVLAARLILPIVTEWPYAFPLGATALLLTALFNRGLALMASALLSLLIMFLSDGQLNVGMALLLSSMAGIFVIGRPERSLKFLLAGVVIAVVTFLTQLALALPSFNELSFDRLAPILLFSGVNGALAAILALGFYNLMGHLAGIATPFQLMELAHPAQPLLRKLMREAPGTYYHSIAVGNLAESAAEAVGADALLLRVAAYYHDIGKTIRPYFFTDNQSDRENVHNDLDPRTSAEIIADHVREGVNMARAAGLPRQLVDFIPTHHGTSVIRHFYQIALQQEDTVNVEDFRYPGPKPQTREQAILMLSDTVEATVRSKAQHGKLISARQEQRNGNGSAVGDKQTLEEMVSSIIDERVRSGQLDESPLTLHDIARIRQAFISSLQGIYHPRVEYAPQIVKTNDSGA